MNVKKQLIIWLDQKTSNLPSFSNISNYQYIRSQWNTLNSDNTNVRKVDEE